MRLVLVKGMPLSVCLLSSNDPYVPPPLTLQLSNLIQAQNIEVKNATLYGTRWLYQVRAIVGNTATFIGLRFSMFCFVFSLWL